MESLDETEWDVVIAGTGLQESLLALSLSRSTLKILHVDKNEIYGGPEAALSLQDAEAWAHSVNNRSTRSYFSNVRIVSSDVNRVESVSAQQSSKTLSFSRAYSLCLSPQVIYTRSVLLPALVAAKVDSHLEFLMLGSWLVYQEGNTSDGSSRKPLSRVPSRREDLVSNQSMDIKYRRALTRLLRFLADLENQEAVINEYSEVAFSDFLTRHFKIPSDLQHPIHALTMSSRPLADTLTGYAVRRVTRHLRSIGLFGPGFGAVVPKWGGLAEVCQVSCRACAVGGGVYNLNNGLKSISTSSKTTDTTEQQPVGSLLTLELQDGTQVKTTWLVASEDNLPAAQSNHPEGSTSNDVGSVISRAICIVSSDLASLFDTVQDPPGRHAGAVVFFPPSNEAEPPIYIIAHNSDTGECPSGQCVLYASVEEVADSAQSKIDRAVDRLLSDVEEETPPTILWKMHYEQHLHTTRAEPVYRAGYAESDNVIYFPAPSLDNTFDDDALERVQCAWQQITAAEADGFLQFRPREEPDDEDSI